MSASNLLSKFVRFAQNVFPTIEFRTGTQEDDVFISTAGADGSGGGLRRYLRPQRNDL